MRHLATVLARMRLSVLLTEIGRVLVMGVIGDGIGSLEIRWRRARLKSGG